MYSLRIVIITIFTALLCLTAFSMPPHPDLFEKLASGEVGQPIFLTDPEYSKNSGINQGSDKPLQLDPNSKSNWNTLAVLVEFSDKSGTVTTSDFDTLIFGQTHYIGASLKEFYGQASYGTLDLVTVNYPSQYGWWGLANSRHHYTQSGGAYTYGLGTYPNNSQGLCEEIINLIDPVINFSNYDNNGDGYVDGIIIIHAGQGAEISGDTLDIWSHQWEISPQSRDGVLVKNYCVDPEYRYIAGDGTVGVFAHEFGHILGLPDLYDYDVPFDSYGLGYWSLMAYGGWNGNLGTPDTLSGSSPAFLDAWSRIELGFVSPTYIPCFSQNIHIPAVEDSAVVYKLCTYNDTTSLEYFLVENRFSVFTDTALAAHGLLIYHIDENQANNDNQWWPGQPAANHYMVALEQSDNSYNLEHAVNGMDLFDPFRAGFNNSFDNSSLPSSQDYTGANTYISITNMTNSAYVMTADMDVGATTAPNIPVLNYPDDGYVTGYQLVTLSWDASLCASEYHCQIDDDPAFSTPLYDDNSLLYNNIQFTFYGHPDGEYYWRSRAGNNIGWSGWSETRSLYMDRVAPSNSIASSPDTTYSSSFIVTWSAGTDPAPSSGICSYRVYADSGTGFYIWHSNIDALEAEYTGAKDGVKYYFQARAVDCAQNAETQEPAWEPECSTYASITTVGYPYLPGDVNMYVGVWGGAGGPRRQSSDVTYLVNFFKGNPIAPCYLYNANYTGTAPSPGFFWASADFNGNCKVQSSDVTRLVNLFKGAIPEEEILRYCGYDQPDQENYFVPLWPNAGDPGEATPQAGWTSLPNALCLPLPPLPTNVRIIPSANSD